MSTSPPIRHPLRSTGALPALAAVAMLAACTTTTQVVRPGGDLAPAPVEDRRNAQDPAEIERRARLRLELAALYFSRNQASTALEELRAALAAKPDMPEAHSLRGLILASQSDFRGSEESFQRALQLDPRNADAMHNYGWVLCQQRRYDEAEAQFRNAVAQPQYGEQMRTLLAQGVCQARAGRWAEAEKTLSRSYELDPANPATAYNLSEVLMRRGELERARFYIRRVNQVAGQTTAQSLWLAARIERRLGNTEQLADLGRQLRDRFPQSPEALQFERGRFDD
jgi:type IV pilus assembly protein PilF